MHSHNLGAKMSFITYRMEIDEQTALYITVENSNLSLNEARHKGNIHLVGQYSASKHKIQPPGQDHIHVYMRQNQLFAINFDGTAHDRSHGVEIPNKVYKALASEFPNLKLPSNRVIESIENTPLAVRILLQHLCD